MNVKHTRLSRRLAILVATIPLLATGTCLSMTQEALIAGFFSAVTASGVEQISEALGTTSASTSGGTTTTTTGCGCGGE